MHFASITCIMSDSNKEHIFTREFIMADICCDLYASDWYEEINKKANVLKPYKLGRFFVFFFSHASCHIAIEGIRIIYIHIVEEKQRVNLKGITW
jgi:hypothetical protein